MPASPTTTVTHTTPTSPEIRDDGARMKIQAHGIETDLLPGWEGRISLRSVPSAKAAGPDRFGPGALTGPLTAVLRGQSTRGSCCVSDLTFVNPDGDIVVELEGVETHLLPAPRGATATWS